MTFCWALAASHAVPASQPADSLSLVAQWLAEFDKVHLGACLVAAQPWEPIEPLLAAAPAEDSVRFESLAEQPKFGPARLELAAVHWLPAVVQLEAERVDIPECFEFVLAERAWPSQVVGLPIELFFVPAAAANPSSSHLPALMTHFDCLLNLRL